MKKEPDRPTPLLKTLADLVGFVTIADRQDEISRCLNYVSERLNFYPFIVRGYEHNGVQSRVWFTQDTLTPDIILNAHVDVVPGPVELFTIRNNGEKIFGRGVMDMKFAVACFIHSLETVYQRSGRLPSLAVMLTSDEERGGMNGVGYLVEEIGFRPKVVLIPDGGDNNHIVQEAKGVLHLRVSAEGKSAHASEPWLGDNAIAKIVRAAGRVDKLYPSPPTEQWKTTLNIGKISGGLQTNQVPDRAEMYLDIRYTPEILPDDIIVRVKKASSRCSVDLLIHAHAFKISPTDPYIGRWADLLGGDTNSLFVRENGASDGRFFSAVGVPTIVSQPVGGAVHSDDEWCDIKSFYEFNQRTTAYLRQFI